MFRADKTRETPVARAARLPVADSPPPAHPPRRVLAASLVGSIVEWYDLFVYGSLVVVLSAVFFPRIGNIPPLLPALAAFVAGAAVRPLGGAIFGRLGDRVGRRFTFLLTIVVMGLGSVAVGLLPTYAEIGIWAPIGLVSLRIIQGLSLGGEYGGGVIYVAENAADARRGFWTSLLQASATLGLLLATGVVLFSRVWLGAAAFASWGWRLPFLGASVLIVVAVAIRWTLTETPLYERLQELRRTSRAPLRESLRSRANLRRVLYAMAVVGGASVVWHTAQFYTPVFLQSSLHLDIATTATITLVALALAAPFYLLFGALSDRYGRLRLILLGSVLGAISFYPSFLALTYFSAPPNLPALTLLLFGQLVIAALCYAPLGAYLVELFPARIRYTSLSIAYGVGTGDIGDATVVIAPLLAFLLGSIYAGLIWSLVVPLVGVAIAVALFFEQPQESIWTEVEPAPPVPALVPGE